jgi:hypothetical protein
VVEQGRADLELVDRPQARSVAPARIGGVGAVTDRLDPALAGHLVHLREPHRPAVITAVVVVGDERRVRELRERHLDVLDPDLGGHLAGVVELRGRQGLAPGGTGDRGLAQGVVGQRGDDARVHTPRERDHDAVAPGEVGPDGVEPVGQRHAPEVAPAGHRTCHAPGRRGAARPATFRPRPR